MSYHLPPEKDQLIRTLLADGLSIRKVQRITGATKTTISRRLIRPEPEPRKQPKTEMNQCDNCRAEIPQTREFHRRTRRTKHKFCTHKCFGEFYMAKRRNNDCKRCGKHRYEQFGHHFTRGYCEKCYAILREFNFDSDAASAHELTRTLIKEIQNGRHQEHGGPAGNAY